MTSDYGSAKKGGASLAMLAQIFETVVADLEADASVDILVVPPHLLDLESAYSPLELPQERLAIERLLLDGLSVGTATYLESPMSIPAALRAVLSATDVHDAARRYASAEQADVNEREARFSEEIAFLPLVPVEQSPLQRLALAHLLAQPGVVAAIGGPAGIAVGVAGPFAPLLIFAGVTLGAVLVAPARWVVQGAAEGAREAIKDVSRDATRRFILDKLGLRRVVEGTSAGPAPVQRSAPMDTVNAFIQGSLQGRDIGEASAVEAARWLHEAKLLEDDPARPGRPLRSLLRSGLILGAEQRPARAYGRWYIRRV